MRNCTRSSPCQRSIAMLAGRMHIAAAVLQQRFPERLTRRPEGNCVHELSIAGTKARADMVLTDRIGVSERVRRQSKYRFGVARTVWPGTRQQFCERKIKAAG